VLLDALARFTDLTLARKSLALALGGTVEAREATALYFGLARRPETRKLAVDFVKKNYDVLKKALPEEWESSLVQVPIATCDPSARKDLETFFKPRITAALGGPREYANALDEYELCLKWRAKQVPEAVRYLNALPR
jgi:hypothetical protein